MALVGRGFVFLHVPKTGGSYARELLRTRYLAKPIGNEHSFLGPMISSPPIPDIDVEPLLPRARRRVVIAFLRNPIDWYRSFWAYRVKNGWETSWHPDVCRHDNYGGFLWLCLQRDPTWLSRMYLQYVQRATFVGAAEFLDDDLAEALRLAGYDHRPYHTSKPENVVALTREYEKRFAKELGTLTLSLERELGRIDPVAGALWRITLRGRDPKIGISALRKRIAKGEP